MPNEFHHKPVLQDEITDIASKLSKGLFLDGTLGGAGHAVAILESNAELQLIGIDTDTEALKFATKRLEGHSERIETHNCNFSDIEQVLGGRTLSGFLFDLGVSSHQIDSPERGFSYRFEGPLDMRMGEEVELSADEVVNTYETYQLAHLINQNSDERFANRIAKAIVASRPIKTTTQLAEVIANAIPAAARRTGGHPAKRTFQAIRIEVNAELSILAGSIETAVNALDVGGIGMVITYHSGEDKIVARMFRELAASSDPQGLPVVVDKPNFSLASTVKAGKAEQEVNSRSRSARLRVIERVAA